MGTDYNLLGSTEVLEELQSGRTRELLMLLQDKPVPEVQDPINLQGGLSSDTTKTGDDYVIDAQESSPGMDTDTGSNNNNTEKYGLEINPNVEVIVTNATVSSNTVDATSAYIHKLDGTLVESVSISEGEVSFSSVLSAGTSYLLVSDADGAEWDVGRNTSVLPYTGTNIDVLNGVTGYTGGSASPNSDNRYAFDSITTKRIINNGTTTDRFTAPTTDPADFQQWNAIQARDVTTGGSTSTEPVEFEILDSTDTVLNPTRIPKARIADEPFTMRNRVYSESAGSSGQSDYTIATTGDGGHFGIPILTVVSVKKNGSVLDSANWSFDPDTDTVTIDTSNVTIASGDTIDIKYDFDVFDSTLQPRAYLSRASTSEASPSISHFRYEYVI